jgi:hypothetical protein
MFPSNYFAVFYWPSAFWWRRVAVTTSRKASKWFIPRQTFRRSRAGPFRP